MNKTDPMAERLAKLAEIERVLLNTKLPASIIVHHTQPPVQRGNPNRGSAKRPKKEHNADE